MSSLQFQLFGKFSVQRDSQSLHGIEASKEQELLSYLLIHRDRSHPREALASMLWGNASTERSRKYLRQALWHLHTTFEASEFSQPPALLIEHDWVRINLHRDIWLDVAVFEQAFVATQGISGKHLDQSAARMLKEAVSLYIGDLLDGWYLDWCLFERERLQNAYLLMLDKLMSYAAEQGDYEVGQGYGLRILQIDRASERTYRRLMRLQYMLGDRTAALRQYQRCVTALGEELDVKPEKRTQDLYQQIRADRFHPAEPAHLEPATRNSRLSEELLRLKRLQMVVAAVQRRIQKDISAVEEGAKTND
jgi:DNA-binding SARP family transcriptional activator